MSGRRPIPVFVLTGFLGSGKTTLLNRLIKSKAFSEAAVIINEFGEVGLDHHLMEGSDDGTIELSNGCLCCTVRGQLVETLEELADRRPSCILIETTGLADPVPVLQAVIASPTLQGHIMLEGLLTVFDAVNGAATLEEHEEARSQLRLADRVIISKLDQLAEEEVATRLKDTKTTIRNLNPAAPIVSRETFLQDLETAPNMLQNPLQKTAPEEPYTHHHHHDHDHDHAHDVNRHSDRIQAVVLRNTAPVDRQQIDMFVDLLLSAHGDHVLRLKGLAHVCHDERPLLVQAVQRSLSPPTHLEAWPDGNPRTELVVFLKDMKPSFVESLFAGFMNLPKPDTPDRTALTDNPLAVPGVGIFKP